MKRISIILAALIAVFSLVSYTMNWNPLRVAKDSSGETVVLIHGLARGNVAMKTMAKRLVAAGFNVQQVGYKSMGETPELVLNDVSEQINACCAKLTTPVHLVGHSLGGIMARAYLGNHSLPNLKSVVLIGSPNKGTPIVDAFKESWWMNVVGDVALSLNTENKGFLSTLKAPDYPLGVIAGVVKEGGLFSDKIPGDDDGLVPLESTKVEGMNDFIILDVGHGKMRDDETVMAQLIHYLKEGKFKH